MRTERDNQRSRVYNAESSIPAYWGQTIPNEELQGFVDKVLNRAPIRARWGSRRAIVELGRNGGRSYGGRILLGVRGRNKWVICHELAHELTAHRYAAHGPEFCGVFLFLVRTVIGTDAERQLREAFKAHRVKINRKGIPARLTVIPKPYPVSKPRMPKIGTSKPRRTRTTIASWKRAVAGYEMVEWERHWDELVVHLKPGWRFEDGRHSIYERVGDYDWPTWGEVYREAIDSLRFIEKCDAECECKYYSVEISA